MKLRRNLHQSEMQEMLHLSEWLGSPPTLTAQEDELECNMPGDFTAKNCYNFLMEHESFHAPITPYQCIWVYYVPPKCHIFLGMVAQNAIPTTNNLVRRGCNIQNVNCSLCNQAPETIFHLVLHCSYSHRIWNYFLGRYNIRWVQARSVEAQFHA